MILLGTTVYKWKRAATRTHSERPNNRGKHYKAAINTQVGL